MTSMWKPPADQPTLTLIDLREKHKGTGAFELTTATDAAGYLTRTIGADLLSGSSLEALSQYVAREGAAWVEGVNFHTKKFGTMIKELELAATASKRRNGNPFGLLVLSTGKNDRPVTEQMEKLKLAGFLTLKYLGVDRNRAFLAIHNDTDNLHLHIIYCRYDIQGALTEREPGKSRKPCAIASQDGGLTFCTRRLNAIKRPPAAVSSSKIEAVCNIVTAFISHSSPGLKCHASHLSLRGMIGPSPRRD